MSEELLTVKEAAKVLHTNPGFVYKLKDAGLLKFMKLGTLKCRRAALDKFIQDAEGYDLTDPANPVELEKQS